MLRLALGSIASLSEPEQAARWLSPSLLAVAPSGKRRSAWLAGRVLLAQMLGSPLRALADCANGKPALPAPGPFFNLSHSGDCIAVALSEKGEVGCDIEVIRPRKGWPRLAATLFSEEEKQALEAHGEEARLAAFWQLWTLREAVLKQRAGSVWEMAQLDISATSLRLQGLYTGHTFYGPLSVAMCATEPFHLTDLLTGT